MGSRPKRRVLEAFMANVVGTMECHSEADEDTLLNYWVVDEAKTLRESLPTVHIVSSGAGSSSITNDGWAVRQLSRAHWDVCLPAAVI